MFVEDVRFLKHKDYCFQQLHPLCGNISELEKGIYFLN